jgi:Protein tyrosine and serine/threonine kinase
MFKKNKETPPQTVTPISPTKQKKGDEGISAPQKVEHCVHVDTQFNWFGEKSTSMFELVLPELGSGAYGVVYKAIVKVFIFSNSPCNVVYFCQYTKQEVAIKKVRANNSIENEVKVLQDAKGPNIVQYYGCVSNDYHRTHS